MGWRQCRPGAVGERAPGGGSSTTRGASTANSRRNQGGRSAVRRAHTAAPRGCLSQDRCLLSGVCLSSILYSHQAILQTLADLNADATVNGIAIRHSPSTRFSELTAAIGSGKGCGWGAPAAPRAFHHQQARMAPTARCRHRASCSSVRATSLGGMHVICIGNASGLAGILAFLCLHENATVSAWRDPTTWPITCCSRGDVLILDSDDLPAMDGVALKPGVVVVDARHRPDGWLPRRPEDLPRRSHCSFRCLMEWAQRRPARRLASLVAMYRTSAIVSLDS